MCSDAPDTSGVNAAAEASAKLGQEAFDWFKSEYDKTAPERAQQTELANKVSEAQIAGMNFATDEARAMSERNKSVYQPLEDKIVAGAQAYDTPERRQQAAAEAAADVEAAAGRAQQANTRAMMRMGATPGGAASAALMQDASLAKAKMISGATGAATRNVEQQGYARMMDAAALGKGIVSNQATQQQIATNTGGAAVNAGASGLAATQSGAGLMQTGFNTGLQGQQQAGSLYGQAAQIDSATRGQDFSLLGSAFGSFMRSSEKVKSGTGNVTDGTQELAEVNATPVEKDWTYDPSKGGPDDGGQLHTGPMAQKVRAKMGEKAAPGGEVIDMRVMGGKLMAATQALSRDVSTLKRQVARMSRTAA